jgi:hypothetical protein
MKIASLLVLSLVSTFALAGCGKKEAALAAYAKVDEACKAKDKQKAVELAVSAAKENSVFQKAFDATFAEVSDKSKANVCGVHGVELEQRIKNGPAF